MVVEAPERSAPPPVFRACSPGTCVCVCVCARARARVCVCVCARACALHSAWGCVRACNCVHVRVSAFTRASIRVAREYPSRWFVQVATAYRIRSRISESLIRSPRAYPSRPYVSESLIRVAGSYPSRSSESSLRVRAAHRAALGVLFGARAQRRQRPAKGEKGAGHGDKGGSR